MTDDEIALKLMRLYKELRRAEDPEIRQSVCEAIDALVRAVKEAPAPQRLVVEPRTGPTTRA